MLRLEASAPSDPCPVDDPDAIPAWRARARTRLDGLLGPIPERVPLDVEVRETLDCGSYSRQSIVFDSEATMSVPAYLLVPHGRGDPGPAVLAQHGHGPGKSEVCGLDDAEAGYVVLAPDLRGFGERADWTPPDKYGCDLNLVHAVAAGAYPLTQNLWDLARALDVLEQHPLVDPERIGMVGLSYGATMTLFLAAWDARVAAAVVSGYLNTWPECHRIPWNLCGSQVLPGMLTELTHVDLGGLVAPRPLLVETGTEDLIFPEAGARAAVGELRTVYRALGAPEHLVHDVFAGGHRWHGADALPFLDRHLRVSA
jgi:pimeloyl-ACP methyl ester carboxylesterase